MSAPIPPPPAPADVLGLLRCRQWTKNLIVGAAFFFAYWDRLRPRPLGLADLGQVIPAILLFCVMSSGVYILNDIRDRDADRCHPVKRRRPIAAGRVAPRAALVLALALIGLALLAGYLLSPSFAAVLGVYAAIQAAYTLLLKRLALVDIMVIASGFVLRAIAGAVVLPDVTISPWLLLCTFLLALFLALCKRRHEKVLLDTEDGTRHRESLLKYDARLLDQLIAVTAGATVVCYAIYTQWPDTLDKFGTPALGFTVPYVVFGIFRYLDLVYRHDKGGRPDKILLTDLPILVNLFLYAVTAIVLFVLYR